jgi:hypothetical protein
VTAGAIDVFSRAHIALTAIVTGIIAAGIGWWRFKDPRRLLEALTVGLLAAAAVFLWRASANMPQLNRDGLEGFSANDWLAPPIVYVVLSVYAALNPPKDAHRFAQVRAGATIAAFAINVITI